MSISPVKTTGSRAADRMRIYKLALGALFISLSIVLTRYASIMLLPTIRVGFGSIPIQIAGIILGPISGTLVGLVADPLGFILNPQGTYHLGFLLSSALNGFIPGCISYGLIFLIQKDERLQKKTFQFDFWTALSSTIVLTLLCSILLNTMWLAQIFKTNYTALLITRLPAVLVNSLIHFVLLIVLLPALNKAGAGRIRSMNRLHKGN